MPRRPSPAAVARARQLIAELRIRHPREIDLELIAAHLGILIRKLPLRHEEGRLLRSDRYGIINVAESAYASNKWRFVVAHELGHFLRDHRLDSFEACTRGDLSDYSGSGRESEANDFASELLMPAGLFQKRCDRNRPSLHDVAEIAREFQTSMTATALRFVAFAREACAIVHSTGGVVDWVDWSDGFRLAVRKGTRLEAGAHALDLSQGREVEDAPALVDAEAWGDCDHDADVELYEHSRAVAPGTVLTFLWHRS